MKEASKTRTNTELNRALLMRYFKRKPSTTNEVIDRIFKAERKSGRINSRDWKFYVHLNKLPVKLEALGLIKSTSTRIGLTGKIEKVWEAQC